MTSEKARNVIHHFMAALDRKYELVSMEECSLEPENGWIISLCRLPAETDICAIFGGHLKT